MSYSPNEYMWFQVYGDVDQFKLHDVVELVGVLSVIPSLATLGDGPTAGAAAAAGGGGAEGGMDVDFWQEEMASHPPTSKVRCQHESYWWWFGTRALN